MPRQDFRKATGIRATEDDLQKLAQAQQVQAPVTGPERKGFLGAVGDVITWPGEQIGKFVGEQKYGTGLTTEGAPTGKPLPEGTLPGMIASGTATGLENLGNVVGAYGRQVGRATEFVTGMDIVEGGPVPTPEQPQAATQAPPGGVAAPTSPQANFLARQASGIPLTNEEIAKAQEFAGAMGTTFDPQTGYSREPFLAQQAAGQPSPQAPSGPALGGEPSSAQIEASFQAPDGNTYGILAGEKVSEAFERFRAGEATPMTAEQIQAQQAQQATQPQPIAPTGAQAPSSPTFGGQPLSEFLAGGIQLDPQGRQLPPGFTSREEAYPEYEMRGREREQELQRVQEVRAAEREGRSREGEMPFSDAKRKAKAHFAEKGIRNPSVSMVDDLARGIQDEFTRAGKEPEGKAMTEYQRRQIELAEAKAVREWDSASGGQKAKLTDEMNTEISALNSIVAQASNISDVTTEAQRQAGAFSAGFLSPLKWIGGTAAADLAGNLETVKSDAFVSNITEMRKNSPTGGAVGNVSDKDLEQLQSLQTSFRQNLKPTTLRSNLSKYRKLRDKVANDAKQGFIRKYGVENFNKHFNEGAAQQGQATPSPTQAPDLSQYEDSGYTANITG